MKGRVARRQTIAPGVAPRDEEEEAGRGRRPARRQTLGPRAGVDEEVARIRSLTEGLSMAADALLPGASGTPGPAGREEDTRTLRERLHAAWGGKSYYEVGWHFEVPSGGLQYVTYHARCSPSNPSATRHAASPGRVRRQ